MSQRNKRHRNIQPRLSCEAYDAFRGWPYTSTHVLQVSVELRRLSQSEWVTFKIFDKSVTVRKEASHESLGTADPPNQSELLHQNG
jgi:hypothetical protein